MVLLLFAEYRLPLVWALLLGAEGHLLPGSFQLGSGVRLPWILMLFFFTVRAVFVWELLVFWCKCFGCCWPYWVHSSVAPLSWCFCLWSLRPKSRLTHTTHMQDSNP